MTILLQHAQNSLNGQVTWDELNEDLRKSDITIATAQRTSQAFTARNGVDKISDAKSDFGPSCNDDKVTAAKEEQNSFDEDDID